MGDCVRWADLSDDEMEFGDPTEVFGKLPEASSPGISIDTEEVRQQKIKEAQRVAQLAKKKKRGFTPPTTPPNQGISLGNRNTYSSGSYNSGSSAGVGAWRKKLPMTITQPDLDQAIDQITSPIEAPFASKKSQLTISEPHVTCFPALVSDPSISDIAASLVNMQW